MLICEWNSMHELYVTKSIHRIALKHALQNNVTKVLSVNLEIGALSDMQNEWLQKYFDRLSRVLFCAPEKECSYVLLFYDVIGVAGENFPRLVEK